MELLFAAAFYARDIYIKRITSEQHTIQVIGYAAVELRVPAEQVQGNNVEKGKSTRYMIGFETISFQVSPTQKCNTVLLDHLSQVVIKPLTPNRHLHLIERILQNISPCTALKSLSAAFPYFDAYNENFCP